MFVLVSLGILTVVPALLEDSVLGDAAKTAISIARWPLLAIAFGAGLAVLYRHGPSRDAAEWRWVSPGAVVATVLWLMGSALFSVYVSNFRKIGRAACRERGCQYGLISVVAVALKKKN